MPQQRENPVRQCDEEAGGQSAHENAGQPSIGANIRHGFGNTSSPYPIVAYVTPEKTE